MLPHGRQFVIDRILRQRAFNNNSSLYVSVNAKRVESKRSYDNNILQSDSKQNKDNAYAHAHVECASNITEL